MTTQFNFIALSSTGEVLAQAIAYAPLEQEYGDTPGVRIRNTQTGVEWAACPDAE